MAAAHKISTKRQKRQETASSFQSCIITVFRIFQTSLYTCILLLIAYIIVNYWEVGHLTELCVCVCALHLPLYICV